MASTTRTFIVFKDEPEIAPVPVIDRKENQNGTSATYVLAPPPGPLLVYAPDKENIDPLTGTRPNDEVSGKKRKTALTVKPQTTSPTKRLKPLAEKATKKPLVKSRGAEKKSKRTSSKRAATAARVHREPSLPRVTEENEVDQAVIDSKCKDLTVLPLADISEAYDVTPREEDATVKKGETAEASVSTATAPEAEAERSATPPPSTQPQDLSSPTVAPSAASVFSTPERKRIYSAFTFTSPSPAAKRYASARGSSVDRFSDPAF